MIGKQILNYKIDSLLGKGGMGTVYLGKHMKMERKVAIKMLHPDLSSNESLRERFKNEASALAQLQNANIVTLYDFEESDQGLFLIMEYIEGMELADHINKVSGPIEEKNAIHYFTQILDGFKYAHKKKVVHRDIKPSNILITSDNEIKIMDFGIAKIVDSEKSLTKTGTQIGTVFYMSPEQVKGENIDHRSDIYSLGVTLFQMITGQCPYNNDTTEFQIYNNIVNDPLPDPTSIYPAASKHLAQVITKATQKNVEDRFQSCEEFKMALNDTAFKTDIKEPTPSSAANATPKTQVKESAPSSSTPPKKKKNTAIIIVMIVAVAIGGGYLLKENTDLFVQNNDENNEKSSNDEADANTNITNNYEAIDVTDSITEIQSNSNRVLVNNWLELKVEKSYFYDYPEYDSQKNTYIVYGQKAYCYNVSGDFVKVSFTRKGRTTEGWMLKDHFYQHNSKISGKYPQAEEIYIDSLGHEISYQHEEEWLDEEDMLFLDEDPLTPIEKSLVGYKKFGIQFIWDKYGEASIKKTGNVLKIEGVQQSNDHTEYCKIKGEINIIDDRNFIFTGNISLYTDDCCGEINIYDSFTFRRTGNRKYYRLKERSKLCDEYTCCYYMDIFL